MASERDPRVDPMPGDVLEKGKSFRRVKRLPGSGPIHGGLGFTSPGRYYRMIWPLSIAPWRKWAANAEISHRAEDSTDAR